MSELESFEKWANDQYESIARYETLPTKPYKSLEVEAAHNAWMERASRNTCEQCERNEDDFEVDNSDPLPF